MTLRTYYILDDSEVDTIRKKKNVNRFDKLVIYEFISGGKHVIGYNKKTNFWRNSYNYWEKKNSLVYSKAFRINGKSRIYSK